MKKVTLSLLVAFLFLFGINIQDVKGQHETDYGTVNFKLSCTDSAEETFNRGLALMHHMMYDQAREVFKAAGEADPSCAMVHWGVAMSYIHPLWGQRPSDQELMDGRESLVKATELNPQTEREVAYIEATKPFFAQWEETSYSDQLKAFEVGYRQLHESYPEEVDAAAFYALGLLATAPPDDKSYAHQRKAGAMLEELHRQYPRHPGLFHYTIHAYDNPVLAEKAVKVARDYDKLAPDVPHALHMPSHIFVRLGIWPDVIEWNQRSAEAALRQSKQGYISMHYVHALDYLTYAQLQVGDDEGAKINVQKTLEAENLQDHLGSAYAVASARARYTLERDAWKEAAQIPLQLQNGFPLHKYPAAESIIYYTRGIGSARSGDLEGAEVAAKELDRIYKALMNSSQSYWAALTDAQRMAVRAWTLFEKGKIDKALDQMKQAADVEDAVEKHPVTPGHVLPVRELLGDMYLEADQPENALKAYEVSLQTSANRFRSLRGKAQAAESMGDSRKALNNYKKLLKQADNGTERHRPALDRAKTYIAENEP